MISSETKNGIKFVPREEILNFLDTKEKQAITDHFLWGYNSHDNIVPRVNYCKSSRSAW